jgi:hypothetical protein
MKTKLIMTVVLAVTVGVAAGWLVPHSSQVNIAPPVAASKTLALESAAIPTTANDISTPTNAATTLADRKILYYICPMHPTIHYDHAGNCPICGMKLEAIYASETNAPAAAPSCCGGGCSE